MKKLFTLILFLCAGLMVFAQDTLVVEDFDYAAGDSIINHGWTNHSGTGSQITVTAGSLEYPNYASAGIGNSVMIAGGGGSREDAHKKFTDQTSGAVYLSALVNVASAGTTQEYFLHVSHSSAAGASFRGRIYLKDDGAGGLQFGISKSGASVEFAPTTYAYNTTHLLIMKYEFVGDSAADDVTKLYINPVATDGEPALSTALNGEGSDFPIGAVLIRQGGNAFALQLDGIRVGTSWEAVTIPVELTSFSASVSESGVSLKWQTATEVNNSGFEIQKSTDKISYQSIGFVSGNGTSTQANQYSYIDNNISGGSKYYYRLKQIDLDGTFEYSDVIFVDVTTPMSYSLLQNYPNPFNPSTTINFNIPVEAKVTIRIFDAIGNEIQQVVDNNLSAGNHIYNINLSGISSGIYFYRLEANGIDGSKFSDVKKMMLTK